MDYAKEIKYRKSGLVSKERKTMGNPILTNEYVDTRKRGSKRKNEKKRKI